jgi:catechol 2,3-dioxygenase-like lactoylglutathione lyase family enzyme
MIATTGPVRHARTCTRAAMLAWLLGLALQVAAPPAAAASAPASVPATAGAPALPNDPMEPIATAAGANAGPLSGALIVTRDLDNLRRIYVDGLGLTLEGPLPASRATTDAQRRLWQMPPGLTWQAWRLTRPATPDAIRVLVLVPDVDTPVMRRSYDREETGPYALGFAMRDVRAVDARITALGFRRTLPAVNEYPLMLRDGTEYPVIEASYEIADATRVVLMQRGGGLRATGSIDAATGLGGPSYSSLIVEDAAAMQRFFTTVLDYEARTNREWTVFSPRFRYVTLHAKGARTGNLGLVEYAPADRKPSTGVAPRPPNRGLAGWSFPVRRLDEVLERADAQRVPRVAGPLVIDDPRFGRVRIATVLAPNGLLVELFERRKPR